MHEEFDQRLKDQLLKLEMLPGSIAGKGFEQTSRSSEKGIPVSWNGAAKGDVSVYVFRKRIAGAKSLNAKYQVLCAIDEAIDEVTVSRRKGRPEYDLSVKEGRVNAGRLAVEHGTKFACESLGVPRRTMERYKAEYRKTIAS